MPEDGGIADDLRTLGIGRDTEIATSIGTKIDITPWATLAADTRKFVAALDDRFFGGAMPAAMKATIYDTLTKIESTRERARTGLFLVATSFQYQVAR